MKSHKFTYSPAISQDFRPAALPRKNAMIPMLFQWLQGSYSSPGTPKTEFSKKCIRTKTMGNSMIPHVIRIQNDIFMILGGPWPARAGNLDIPIGILRFLSLPGPQWSLQNRGNHKIPVAIVLCQSKTSFSGFGPRKMDPERYVYTGFLAEAAKVYFWLPRCVFVAQSHRNVHCIGFHRIL